MGLDMYLEKEVFVGANRGFLNEGIDRPPIVIQDYRNNEVVIDGNRVSKVVLEVAYWRKANQIHGWFVDQVQNGSDECQRSYVSKEKLLELLNLCKEVKMYLDAGNHDKVEKLLPPQEGFFFGQYEVNDWYKEDIDNTIRQLEADLNEPVPEGIWYDYYYQASW